MLIHKVDRNHAGDPSRHSLPRTSFRSTRLHSPSLPGWLLAKSTLVEAVDARGWWESGSEGYRSQKAQRR